MTKVRWAFVLMLLVLILAAGPLLANDGHEWNDYEKAILKSLWIGSLPELPSDPSNKYSVDPKAAQLGRKFFFDVRFSGNLKVSCATCHQPDYAFTDNLPLAHGMGTTARRTMPLIGMAYQPWFFWDGRKDSLWSQALGPLESPVEHGFTRTRCFFVINEYYKNEYDTVFGPLPEMSENKWRPLARPATDDPVALKAWVSMTPDMRDAVNHVYANLGKAIGAYVRTIVPGASRFDDYVAALVKGDVPAMKKALTDEEVTGLRLFIGKAKCVNCHNGPMLTNGDFHNVEIPDPSPLSHDRGRAEGILLVLADEFNCLSKYSDAEPRQCVELRFIDTDTDKYSAAFKTPTLRNVAERPPYMHAGQFKTLLEVLDHYRSVTPGEGASPELGHRELTDEELVQLEAFLKTLSGPIYERKP